MNDWADELNAAFKSKDDRMRELEQQVRELQRQVQEREADKKRLDAIESECWELRCVEERYPDDADVRYDVVGFWMSEPKERVLGSGRDPREAIDAAMAEDKTP